MRTATSQEGQDHATSLRRAAALAATLLVVAALAAGAEKPAAAQGAVPCTAIENDAERLACYDRALRPAPAAQPSAAAAPQATEIAPRGERTVRQSTAPAAAAAPVAGTASSVADDGVIPIVIVGVRRLPGREATFTAQDGTTWVQSDSTQITNLPEAPFEAEIQPGAMGSRFLLPKDYPRRIRVRPPSR